MSVCPRCKGEGMWWDYGLKDVVMCPDCKGKGVVKQENKNDSPRNDEKIG